MLHVVLFIRSDCFSLNTVLLLYNVLTYTGSLHQFTPRVYTFMCVFLLLVRTNRYFIVLEVTNDRYWARKRKHSYLHYIKNLVSKFPSWIPVVAGRGDIRWRSWQIFGSCSYRRLSLIMLEDPPTLVVFSQLFIQVCRVCMRNFHIQLSDVSAVLDTSWLSSQSLDHTRSFSEMHR